jgi:peptidyl-prolyl cis-trans isomerase SurA
MKNPRLWYGVAGLVVALAGAVAAGCAAESGRTYPSPIAATPPAGYPLDRERPGGSVEAVPSPEAPVAKPIRDDLPAAEIIKLPAQTGTAPSPVPIPVPPDSKVASPTPTAPALDPTAGQTIPLSNSILAEVNGDVITREEIINPLRPQIEIWREHLSKEDYEERCRYYIYEDLLKEISRRLVLQEARTELSTEEKKAIDAQVAQVEKNQISEAGSKPRLEARLAAEGTTLARENARMREGLMVQRLLHQKLPADFQVTHSELQALYDRVKTERYVVPEEARLLMITLKKSDSADAAAARAKAEAVYDRVRGGENFGKLAAQYSTDPKAKAGGDWGMVGRDSLKAEAVSRALFASKQNELAPLVETADSYYIVKCLERQEGRTKPFGEVQAELEREIRVQKRDAAVSKYITELRDKSYINVIYNNM